MILKNSYGFSSRILTVQKLLQQDMNRIIRYDSI